MYKAGKFGFMARKIIGVTGTIGTGKSTAAKMLKSMGGKNVLVLDADRIAKKFLKIFRRNCSNQSKCNFLVVYNLA